MLPVSATPPPSCRADRKSRCRAREPGRATAPGDQEIGHLDAGGRNAGKRLFGVHRQLIVEIPVEACDVTPRRRHGQTVVKRPEVGRKRAAAGVAGHSDAGRIRFGAAEQVIEPAHRIPDPPEGEIVAEQPEHFAELVVLVTAPLRKTVARRADELQPFPLPGRVPAAVR